MKKIIYRSQQDAKKFDIDRFVKSLGNYAKVPKTAVKAALEDFSQYDLLHVSCLVEVGYQLITKYQDSQTAEKYLAAHAEYFDEGKFERLRRITGYLVGTLDRWNDAKKAEESARVKHSLGSAKVCVNSALNDTERLAALENQAMERNIAYAQN